MANKDNFDVIVVGAGITGAITANELAKQGLKVLILEAGAKKGFNFEDYRKYLDNYHTALVKTPNSPFPANAAAPQPTIYPDQQGLKDGVPQYAKDSYFHQVGPSTYQSTYTRSMGGTTLHWLGTCLRMLPSDFKEFDLYNKGKNWPISYYDLMPYYRKAEEEIGVSADVSEQSFFGIKFEEDYVYPMNPIPSSYLDKTLSKAIKGTAKFKYDGKSYDYSVVNTPAGRNSSPNPKYNNGKGYQVVGAVGNPDLGQRCEGNSSCVPLCPVQAKYNALKTLSKAVKTGNVEIWDRSVVSRLLFDEKTGEITSVEYTPYEIKKGEVHTKKPKTIKAKRYVLACHAIENAKIMLTSKFPNKNIGQNLMDHPVLLSWGLTSKPIGANRGPGSTSGIPGLRDGDFRSERSAFRIEIGNWGWNWPEFTPDSTLENLVSKKVFGKSLRQSVLETSQRQFRLGFLIEQQPSPNNNITIDDRYRDKIGNHRPIINYSITDHEKRGMVAAKEFTKQFFDAAGVTNMTNDYADKDDAVGFLNYEFEGKNHRLWWQGAGHYAGTHIMGTDSSNSVVNKEQRCHDHKNLFLVGCGNMPTMGTSNPTLTISALSFWAAENIAKDLKKR